MKAQQMHSYERGTYEASLWLPSNEQQMWSGIKRVPSYVCINNVICYYRFAC